MTIKTYVLDTNILLDDPSAVASFDDNEVIIPLIVLEEIDRFKDKPGELGANAREFSRYLGKFIADDSVDLRQGTSTPTGGFLKVVTMSDLKSYGADLSDLPELNDYHGGDNKILQVMLGLANKAKKESLPTPILVTRDLQLRVKCRVLGILSEDRKKSGLPSSVGKLYTGVRNLEVSWGVTQAINEDRETPISLSSLMEPGEYETLSPNEYITLKSPDGTPLQNIYRHVEGERFAKLTKTPNVYKLRPRNVEQKIALDMLMDPSIKLVSLIGKSGSGKTLAALAAGLEQVLGQKKYKSLVVCRPIEPVGRDVGYLPGPQPLDAKILTPTGWTTMGQLKVGDKVIARDGTPTKIIGIFPKGKKEVFKIKTTDGSSTEACDDHLWLTQTWEDKKRGKNGSVRTTKEIRESLQVFKNKKNRPNHYLPRNKEIQFTSSDLPLSPYVLGVLLGDGSITDSVIVSSDPKDNEIIERVKEEVRSLGCFLHNNKGTISWNISSNNPNNKPARSILLTNITTGETNLFNRVGEAAKALNLHPATINYRCGSAHTFDNIRYEYILNQPKWTNPIKNILFVLGLQGTYSTNKFIPEKYLYASSIKDRVSLLNGLMDTDGTIKTNGEASYSTVSTRLRDDIITLVKTLGGNAKFRTRDRRGKKSFIGKSTIESKNVAYDISISLPEHINPFFLSRKALRHKCSYIHDEKISEVKSVGFKEVQCILVEHPEHLYITDDFIVTHNTMGEKMDPWTAPIKDNLKYLLSSADNGDVYSKKNKMESEATLDQFIDRGIIEIQAITFIRGRSISNAYIILDEAQNTSAHELKTIITRVGEGTKIVLVGDVEQVDNIRVDSMSNGLTVAVEKFRDSDITSHISLLKGERSELASLAASIL